MTNNNLPSDYPDLLNELKHQITSARIRAKIAVNQELVMLYWRIGREILDRQGAAGWGAKIITQLSQDLRKAFPEMTGLSRSNLMYMRKLAECYPDTAIVPPLVGQIPWSHNRIILDKLSDPDIRRWYIESTIRNGWSRRTLELQIANNLYKREGKARTNFPTALPNKDSKLVEQLFKDPYSLEFLDANVQGSERRLELALIDKLKEFMLELGTGFAFVGNQVNLNVGGDDFFVDLLFYHLRLHRYIVIELKTTKFIPEYVSKVNFYCSVIDDQLRHRDDESTIGLILCKSHNKVVAEYSLGNSNSPLGIARYTLPAELQEALPSIELLESELLIEPEIDTNSRKEYTKPSNDER